MSSIEVTIKIGDKRVTLEGPEEFVRSEVQRLTNLVAQGAASNGPRTEEPGTSEAGTSTASERDFVAQKKPGNHLETVAVLGYVLTKRGAEEFTGEDMRRAYARAGVRPPKVMDQALRDAKNLNDYLQKGSAKGAFCLTPHGIRTVEFDLPRKSKA